MNATTQAIIDRLPKKEVLIPAEIAGAFGMWSTAPIIDDIRRGKIAASTIRGRFYISRDEAVRYIGTTEYKADEA